MKVKKNYNESFDIEKELKIDCKNCFGFCCVALYFSKMDGFPKDKVAGDPCSNLNEDFTCKVHSNLREKGLKGCTSYDCFGAGQKVASQIYNGVRWNEKKSLKDEMFEVFLIARQLHEMLWYLNMAYDFESRKEQKVKIEEMIDKLNKLTILSPKEILSINIEKYRDSINVLLKATSIEVSNKSKVKNKKVISKNNIAKNLSKENLRGADLSCSLLIAANLSNTDLTGANLIATDMRDTNIRGANLEKALFITQQQINATIGDSKTKLPSSITRPSYWEK
ncbi:MAG: pentapeptide repeat-containing protein [Sarcina sp.]